MPLVQKPFGDVITFSRASSATMFDSSGTLVYAPMNLLLQSIWPGATGGSPGTAPTGWSLGTVTGSPTTALVTSIYGPSDQAVLFSGVAGDRVWYQQSINVTSGFTYSFSVFCEIISGSPSDVLQIINGTATRTIISDTSFNPSSGSRAETVFLANSTGTLTVRVGIGTDTTIPSNAAAQLSRPQLNLANMQGGVTADLSTYYPTTSAAYQGPRLDYDPSTLAARGLLIEEQRTNLVTYSQDLSNAVWTFTGQLPFGSGSIVNDGIAPDGTTTADKVVEDTSTGSHLINYSSITTSTTTTNSLSFFIKAAGRTSLSIRFGSQGIANRMQADINLNTGAVTAVQNIGTATGATCTATLLPNQWWRITASVNPNDAAATAMRFILYPNGTTNYTGDGVSGVYIWGAQTEAGAFFTSYIPTTTTALTRSADVAAVNTLSPWFNGTEGTLYAELVWEGLKSVVGQAYAQFDDGTTNNRWIFAAGSTNQHQVTTVSGGTSDGSNTTPTTTYVTGSTYKVAAALAANDLQSFINGTAGTADTSVTLPVGLTNFKLGASLSVTANVWLRRATYYPRRLSQAEGIAITA